MDTRHPKPACTEQGLLVSVRSGVNARAVAAAHQSSRSASQGVPIGTRSARHARSATSDHIQHRWSPTAWTVGPRTASANLACSQHSSGGCAISLGTAIQAARSLKLGTPQQGRPGRNDSRCAGITKLRRPQGCPRCYSRPPLAPEPVGAVAEEALVAPPVPSTS